MVTSKPTQNFVPIKEVRSGTVVLKDGSLRAVIMTSSLNFALKSEDEQVALITQFQNFLNGLDFSVQIFIQSRRLDIRPYIALLESRYQAQTSDLMKIQTREYIEFVKNFTENSEIMTKNFFIVVPYTPSTLGSADEARGALRGLLPFKIKKSAAEAARQQESMEETQTQLEQRITVMEQGLVRMGLRGVRLGTEEIIELYYKIFNPGELEKPIPLENTSSRE